MKLRTKGAGNNSGATSVWLRCPLCGREGTLDAIANVPDAVVSARDNNKNYVAGQRLCPNRACRAHLFIVFDPSINGLIASYPAELIDFDATSIPEAVKKALEEAIACHSIECYIAAAIMVRKTLEELCRERGATGDNLKERIRDLGTKIVLPKELLDGLDDLRLLGNDAAHIESQEFNAVGKEEVEIGIEFSKEVLKATYQYSDLLKKLRSLKKTP